MSENDNEANVMLKMKEWMANGCRMAWLVHPQKRETLIFRHDSPYDTVAFSEQLTGEDVLPGFKVVLAEIL